MFECVCTCVLNVCMCLEVALVPIKRGGFRCFRESFVCKSASRACVGLGQPAQLKAQDSARRSSRTMQRVCGIVPVLMASCWLLRMMLLVMLLPRSNNNNNNSQNYHSPRRRRALSRRCNVDNACNSQRGLPPASQ